MKVIRFAERNWRPDSRTLISTGDYWIPRDMSEELAERALREGAAVLVEQPNQAQPKRQRTAKPSTPERPNP